MNGSMSSKMMLWREISSFSIVRSMRHRQNKILGVVQVHMEEELKHDSQFLVGHKINRPPPENAQILSATQHDPSACAICKRSRKEQVPAMRQCWLKPRSGTVPAGIGIQGSGPAVSVLDTCLPAPLPGSAPTQISK